VPRVFDGPGIWGGQELEGSRSGKALDLKMPGRLDHPGILGDQEDEGSRKRRRAGRGGLAEGAAQDAKGSGQGRRWGSRACQDGGVEEMALPSPFLFVKLIP